MEPPEFLGISRPVSLQESTDREKKASETLQMELDQMGMFETADCSGYQHRIDVVTFLEGLVKKWVAEVISLQLSADKTTNDTVNSRGAQLLPFGGQQLGVISKNSDIDLVCLVPRIIQRRDFFTSFLSLLNMQEEICKIRAIEAAYVPIITLQCMGIEVDVCLAILPLEKLHLHLDLTDKALLEDMEPVCIRSLNGVRETLVIQELVPDMDVLRQVVKAVKVWAKAKGLNGTGYGYPSGIAWTVMAARVCQLYPAACPATLLHKFFITFHNWKWPQPVLLKELEHDCFNLEQWNSKVNPSDRFHVMPVITPAYPEHNATYVVTQSTLAVLKKQLSSDGILMENILTGKNPWENLFCPLDFFRIHKHLLMVSAKACTDQDLIDWSGLVGSRIRNLVSNVEKDSAVSLVHPWPHSFKESDTHLCRWFVGIELEKRENLALDLSTPIGQFSETVRDLALSRKLFKEGMTLDIRHVKRKDLKQILGDSFQPRVHGLKVHETG